MVETSLTIIENVELCSGVYKMTLKASFAEDINCGQFINISIKGRKELLLKRPFALMDFDKALKTVTVCYKVVGKGTNELSLLKKGDSVDAIYPLGNGFKLNNSQKTVVLLGGGVGIFPLLSINKTYPDKKYHTMLGFRDKNSIILKDEFESFSKETLICTEDGSFGASGFVTDSLKRNIDRIKPDVILSCGPLPMFRSLAGVMRAYPDIPVYVSMEERMGCGIGACLVCTCAVKQNDKIKNKRVCKDGPVFPLSEVVF